MLLIWDEIQSGLGRTGKLFAYQHESNAKPDLIILGKALSGGVYPVSAVVGTREVLSVFKPGDHGSTFGGNPLGSAVAHAALDVLIDEKMIENSAKMGTYLGEQLKTLPQKHIQEIRQRGLWAGVEIKKSSGPARAFCLKLIERGILAKDTREQVIRLAPALTVTQKEIDVLISAFNEVLKN